MIINLTAHDLTKAVTEYVTKMGISPNAKLDIKYRAGRKGNGTTATVGIDEGLTNASTKASKASVEAEDYEDIPYVGVDAVTAENEEVKAKLKSMVQDASAEIETSDKVEDEPEEKSTGFKSLFVK